MSFPSLVAGLTLLAALAPSSAVARTEPWVVYLWFADGGPYPDDGSPGASLCRGQRPPAFTCGGREGCADEIQAHLESWYDGLNVVFTRSRPARGSYFTQVITDEGSWCREGEGGRAPVACGGAPLYPSTSFAFACDTLPRYCAKILAHEHGHSLGLAHTSGVSDVMNDDAWDTAEGFEAGENAIVGRSCDGRAIQNSYETALGRLGEWAGGPKPPADSFCSDGLPPSVSIDEPVAGAPLDATVTVRASATDDCAIASVQLTLRRLGDGFTQEADGVGPPYEWTLRNLESGHHEITVTATDTTGRSTGRTLRITSGDLGQGGCSFAKRPTSSAGLALLAAFLLRRCRRPRGVR